MILIITNQWRDVTRSDINLLDIYFPGIGECYGERESTRYTRWKEADDYAVMPRWQGARYQNDRFFFFPLAKDRSTTPPSFPLLRLLLLLLCRGHFFFTYKYSSEKTHHLVIVTFRAYQARSKLLA